MELHPGKTVRCPTSAKKSLIAACAAPQVGDLVFSPDGLAKRGVLLRHLVMPGLLDESKAILNWVVKEIGRWVVFIMLQYSL